MFENLKKLNRSECNELYAEILESGDTKTLRELCLNDLFFLLTIGCKRPDANNDWVFDRCREIETEGIDGMLDLWPREHYKSSIKTFAQNIQDILRNPEITIGIFSHTKPIAKSFLGQIKRELEANTFLQGLFPDVLWANPEKESPKWSLDDGIIVRRKSNPAMSTVEAWGLVDGQPTSKHFIKRCYDDIVVKESVTTPEMMKKTTEAWELSLNLGVRKELGGIECYSGTIYHQNDTYSEIINRNAAKPRYHYPTDGGKDDLEIVGKPYLMSQAELIKKRNDMRRYTYSCQMLLNPFADKALGFDEEWIKYYEGVVRGNKYIVVDPASAKKKDSDYTVILVIALGEDNNYYLVDGVRDRLNLNERTKKVFDFHRKYKPLGVGYEKYGMQSDIEHIQYVQEHEGYRFGITELGGSTPKNDRIKKISPIFEDGRFWMPRRLMFINYEGYVVDLVDDFIRFEYRTFPVSAHDDTLDCMSRIVDPELAAVFPKQTQVGTPTERKIVNRVNKYSPLGSRKDRQGSGATDEEVAQVMGRSKNWRETIKR